MARRKKPAAPGRGGPDPLTAALDRYRPLLLPDEFEALLRELERPLFPALRVNTLKTNPDNHIDAWAQRYGWEIRPVPFCPTGYWVTHSPAPISQTIEHRLGFYYIQDAASMLPAELFDLDGLEEPLVLDMAASPGGKTTHIISQLGDRGLVLANDSSADRITALRIVLQNYGAINTAAARFPGEKYGGWYPETFDRVLLDAPCSMQGLKTTDSHPMRPITEREQESLARRQARLLASAFLAVKPGGQVVYSTCTLAPEENEAVLESLVQTYPGAVRIDDITDRLPAPAPALPADGERTFNPQVQRAARLWPHIFGTAGFFAARITKTAPVNGPVEPPPDRPLEQVGYAPLGRSRIRDLAAELADRYGFDLPALMEDQDLDLWQRNETIYAVPNAFLRRFRRLPVQMLGLALGDLRGGRLTLSHEWVARFGLSFSRGRLTLPDERIDAWLRGEDLHDFEPEGGVETGEIVVVVDSAGRNFGRGKVLAGRLKNMLPGRVV